MGARTAARRHSVQLSDGACSFVSFKAVQHSLTPFGCLGFIFSNVRKDESTLTQTARERYGTVCVYVQRSLEECVLYALGAKKSMGPSLVL
jgi:hypothetical protein